MHGFGISFLYLFIILFYNTYYSPTFSPTSKPYISRIFEKSNTKLKKVENKNYKQDGNG